MAALKRSGSGVYSFHKFPSDPERLKLWIIALKHDKPTNPKHVRVCSDHRLDEDYWSNQILQSELPGIKAYRVLEKSAVPSVFSLF